MKTAHSGLNLASCLGLSDCSALQLSSSTLDLWQTGNLSWLLTTSSLDRKIHYHLKSKICLASTHKSQTSMTFSGFPMLHTDIWPAISNKNTTNGAEIRKWNLKQNLKYEGWKKEPQKLEEVFSWLNLGPLSNAEETGFCQLVPTEPWAQPATTLAAVEHSSGLSHLRGLQPSH